MIIGISRVQMPGFDELRMIIQTQNGQCVGSILLRKRRQQQSSENPENRNDDKQLNHRKRQAALIGLFHNGDLMDRRTITKTVRGSTLSSPSQAFAGRP